MHFDLQGFIIAFGYLGVLAFVFAESGLFFGFFLPGDSLLFTAGVLALPVSRRLWVGGGAPTGGFHFGLLAIGSVFAAVLCDSAGYTFGRRVGARPFSRE